MNKPDRRNYFHFRPLFFLVKEKTGLRLSLHFGDGETGKLQTLNICFITFHGTFPCSEKKKSDIWFDKQVLCDPTVV